MRYRQEAEMERLRRAKVFGQAHGAELGGAASAPAFARLDEALTALSNADTLQAGAVQRAQSDTASLQRLRDDLRDRHVRPIVRIAQARRLEIPNAAMTKFNAAFAKLSDASLLTAARAVAVAAEENYTVFRDEGLPNEYLDQLRAAVTALENALMQRDGHRASRKRGVTGIDGSLRDSREIIRILDGLVTRQLSHRPDLMAEWKQAIRIKQKPGLPRGVDDGAAPAAPPALKIA